MQFPDVLPIKPLSHEQNVSADNEDISDSSSVTVSFNLSLSHYYGVYIISEGGGSCLILVFGRFDLKQGKIEQDF